MIGPLRDIRLRLRNIDHNRSAYRISNKLATILRYPQPFPLRNNGRVIPKMNRTTLASRLRPPTRIIRRLARRFKPWERFCHYTVQSIMTLFFKIITIYQFINIRRLILQRLTACTGDVITRT